MVYKDSTQTWCRRNQYSRLWEAEQEEAVSLVWWPCSGGMCMGYPWMKGQVGAGVEQTLICNLPAIARAKTAAPGSTKGLGRAGWEHVCSGLLSAPKEEPREKGNQPCSPVCKGFRKMLRTYYSRKQSAYTSTDLIFNSRAFNQADERYFQMGWTCPA